MNPRPYEEIPDPSLIALCVWREARGEQRLAKRGVAHVIANRVKHPGWWGHDWKSVILKPWQFSSFNSDDPNSDKWPSDDDPSWTDSLSVASGVYLGMDDDVTEGSCYYHDTSMGWPKAWGNEAEYENVINIGRLKFYRMKPATNALAVGQVAAEG